MTENPAGTGIPEFHLGDRLQKALDHAKMSNQEMAEYLGVSRNTVGNYIALRTAVSVGTLRLWSMRTGVPMEWLQTGENPPGPNGPRGLKSVRGDQLPRLDSNQEPSGYGVVRHGKDGFAINVAA